MVKLKLQYCGYLLWRTDSLKRPWCWERLKAGGEGDNRGWDGWMTSLTQWTWVWANSRRQWMTGKPGVLQSMGLQRTGHDWATQQQFPWNPSCQTTASPITGMWTLAALSLLNSFRPFSTGSLSPVLKYGDVSPTLKQRNPSFLLQFFFGICVLSHFSQSDSATHWTVACQAPLSMEFSRWEYWSGLPFPSPGDLPNPGVKPESPVLQADSLPTGPPGKPSQWP